MHTFERSKGNEGFVVVFCDSSARRKNIICKVEHRDMAMSIVSYLNGGLPVHPVPAYWREQFARVSWRKAR